MNRFISSANGVLSDWCEKFDGFNDNSLKFEKREGNRVTLNGEVMLLVKDNEYVDSAFFDIENIILYLSTSRVIHIIMGWENEKPPYIKNVYVKPLKVKSNRYYEEY